MAQEVKLYDPHPGFGGALLPLPRPMKEIADKLNGQSMSLEKAIEMISSVAEKIGGKVAVEEEHKYIRFWMESYIRFWTKGPLINSYRLLNYK